MRPTLAALAIAFSLSAPMLVVACGDNKAPDPTSSSSSSGGAEADASGVPKPGATSTNGVNPVGKNTAPPDAGHFWGGSRLPQ